jgi:lipopolysaccharide transport system ATP-binding protein
VVLRAGRIVFAGGVDKAVAEYSSREGADLVGDLQNRRDRSGTGQIQCLSLAIRNASGDLTRSVRPQEPFEILVNYEAKTALRDVVAAIVLELLDGTRLSTLDSQFRNEAFSITAGSGSLSCKVAGLPLKPDTYSFSVFLGGNHAIHDYVMRAMSFEVAPTDVFGTGRLPDRSQGAMIVDYRWTDDGRFA